MRSATCIYFELSWDLRTRLLCVMNRVDVCKLAIDKRFLKLTFQTLALRQSALMKSYCRNVIFRISCFPLLQYHSFLRNLLPTYFLMLIFVIIGRMYQNGRMYHLFISTCFYIEFSLPVTPVTHPICTQKAQTFQGPLAILLEFQCKSIPRDFRILQTLLLLCETDHLIFELCT